MQFAGLKVSPTVAAGFIACLLSFSSMTGVSASAAEVSSAGTLSFSNATASSLSSWSESSSSVIIVIGNPGGPGPIFNFGGYTVRHEFAGPALDGAHPVALVRAQDGTIYGSTRAGGANNAGTLFKIGNGPGGGTYSVLHSFDGAEGGSGPAGSLVAGADGNIYGVTSGGGAYHYGTIFRMSPAGSVTVLHSFGAELSQGAASIVNPMTLMQASDGNFYGLTAATIIPGFAEFVGTIRRAMFKMSPDGTVTKLAGFAVSAIQIIPVGGTAFRDAGGPDAARMVESNAGAIYFASDARLYRYEHEGNRLTQVELPAGLTVPGNLLRAANGNIYGTAYVISRADAGLIKIAAADDAISQLPGTLKDFRWPLTVPTPNVVHPAGNLTSLTEGKNGVLYGVWAGGAGSYLFSINPETDQSPQILYRLLQPSAEVHKSLVVDQVGYIWGVASNNSMGSAFSYFPTGVPNHPPVAQDDHFAISTSEAGSGAAPSRTLTVNLLANDSDPDMDALSVVEATSNTGTIAELKADGTITVIQSGNLAQSVQVNYTVMDARGATAAAKAVFSYTAPVAQNDVFRIGPAPRETSIDVVSNDTVTDGSSLVITACTRAKHGRVRISEDGKSLRYKPGPQYSSGDSFEYTVSDGAGGTATAKVRIENPFLGLKGDYYGLSSVPVGVGSVRLLVSPTGAFSAAAYYGGQIFRFRGQLSPDGEADIPISRKGVGTLVFRVSAKRGKAPNITAFIQFETHLFGMLFAATANRTAAQTPGAIAGGYTVVFPADSTQPGPNYPQGDGFALLKMKSNGVARLVGRLGDGVSFSGSSLLLADRTLPFYLDAYRKRIGQPGGISGTLRFPEAEASDVSGKLRWTKPRQSVGAYAAGFAGTIGVVGCRWFQPEQSAEKARLWTEGAMLHMGEGELSKNIKKRVALGSGKDLMLTPVSEDKMKLQLDPATGFFSGEFVHPDTGESHPIEGVVLQNQQRGAGVFAGGRTTGWVSIEPRE